MHRRGRGAHRAHQVNHAALAHAAVEIAVRGRGAHLARGQHAVAHTQTGAAGGIGDAETGIHINFNKPLFQGLGKHLRRGRRENGADIVRDSAAFQHCCRSPQILNAAVGAGPHVHLVNPGAGHVGNILHLIRLETVGHLRAQIRHVKDLFGHISRVRIGMPLFKIIHRGINIGVLLLNKGPEISGGNPVGHTHPAGGAGLDRHIAQGHARLHTHGVHHRTAKLHHLVGRAVHRQFLDDAQNDILGIHPFAEFSGDDNLHRFRQPERTDALQNADLQIGGADAGGKCAEGAVGAGM